MVFVTEIQADKKMKLEVVLLKDRGREFPLLAWFLCELAVGSTEMHFLRQRKGSPVHEL